VPHLLTKRVALVGEHVDDDQLTVAPERSSHLGEDARRVGDMMQNEHQRGDVQRVVLDRQGLEGAGANVDVVQPMGPMTGGLEHRIGIVDGDNLPGDRRPCRRQTSTSTAKVADDGIALDQRQGSREMDLRAVELVPESIPTLRGLLEEGP